MINNFLKKVCVWTPTCVILKTWQRAAMKLFEINVYMFLFCRLQCSVPIHALLGSFVVQGIVSSHCILLERLLLHYCKTGYHLQITTYFLYELILQEKSEGPLVGKFHFQGCYMQIEKRGRDAKLNLVNNTLQFISVLVNRVKQNNFLVTEPFSRKASSAIIHLFTIQHQK